MADTPSWTEIALKLAGFAVLLAAVGWLTVVPGRAALEVVVETVRPVPPPTPSQRFQRITTLRLPATARIVSTYNTHGGFHGDGTFQLIADVAPSVAARWLLTPVWEHDAWETGPVSDAILARSELKGTLPTTGVHHLVHLRGPGSMPAHNGEFVAIDPVAGRVWVARWDF